MCVFPDCPCAVNYEAEILAEALRDFEFGRNAQVLAPTSSLGTARHVLKIPLRHEAEAVGEAKQIRSNPSFFNSLKISRDTRDSKLSYLLYMLLRREKDSTPQLLFLAHAAHSANN
ncbi:hypothetical protein K443DRAFT_10169 [Laccaria amethystina LaAM-08-1]|uniref:Uncharacterized protein n=1 Tax=Laccaria amethystina LaAM-08-1 TaxID=1095629 RepID=A0A0C9X6W0_9AGAR|nr:hypothetical protein K443DRAFT_10169 [Laccaria amethystina LaAM-08-1]